MNKEISVYDNTISARTYLSYIAEQAGGFAIIGRDGKLYIKTIGEKSVTLPLKLFKNFKWGEKFKITRVRYEDGIQMYEKGTVSGNTVYINQENMFIVNQEQIDNIYNSLKDLEVYSFEGESIIDPSLDEGDILIIDGKKVIYQGSGQYSGRWTANISSKIQGKSKEETTTKKTSQKVINRRVQSQINQAEGKITQLIEETTEQSQKITEVGQTIDGISQKVESIQDFTKEKTQTENIFLNDIAEGEGYVLKLQIYGDTDLFTSKTITICASQYVRGYGSDISLLAEDGQELLTEDGQQFIIGEGSYFLKSLKITLDDYLRSLTKDGQQYFDTLEIEQDGTIKIIRRIGVNAQGGLYVLAKEIETMLEEKIVLPSQKDIGTYYFIKEIQGLKYYANYIIENDYSKTFLTKLELGTKIEQNAEAVKVAWNQISDFIQMMIINNNASFAILDKNKKIMMSLDKNGQNFYDENSETIFGEMGVHYEKEESSNISSKYIAFGVQGEYEENIKNGMAWGILTKSDNKFHPIFYIKNFQMGEETSDASYGELILSSCDMVLDGVGTGIVSGDIKILGDTVGGSLYFYDKTNDKYLMEIHGVGSLLGKNEINILDIFKITEEDNEKNISILNNIEFYQNQAGSNSFKIGTDGTNYVLFTDDGSIYGTKIGSATAEIFGKNFEAYGHIYCNNGVESFSTIEKKKNIKKYNKSGLNEVLNTDIYYFNYKEDEKTAKARIGTIIGKKYKCSEDIISQTGESISDYSMISIAYKAIQEQQQQIEDLKQIINNQQKQINKLLGGK